MRNSISKFKIDLNELNLEKNNMTKKNKMMVYVFLKGGNKFPVSSISGKELIKKIWTDDYSMPPESLVLDTKTENGERVRTVIPFDGTNESYAIIEITKNLWKSTRY
jgi:hypothetical protein